MLPGLQNCSGVFVSIKMPESRGEQTRERPNAHHEAILEAIALLALHAVPSAIERSGDAPRPETTVYRPDRPAERPAAGEPVAVGGPARRIL